MTDTAQALATWKSAEAVAQQDLAGRVSRSGVYKLVARGVFRTLRIGRRLLIDPESVKEWVAGGMIPAGRPAQQNGRPRPRGRPKGQRSRA